MGTRLIGYTFIGVSLILIGGALYLNTPRSDIPLVFSPTQMMDALWMRYKAEYIEQGSYRALDKQREQITTSEGQSYTMLRAVWMGDKETFDGAWDWTQANLERPDNLFSWLYGRQVGGTWGILTEEGGQNTASDADQDIALALIFAYARWQDPRYLSDAREILDSMWEQEVMVINGAPYLLANSLEKTSGEASAILNPSYLSPASYRVFARVDPSHDWEGLAESSYQILERTLAAPLDTGESAGLPPDWVRVHKVTGVILPAENLSSNFSYDALRIPWRVALDYQWFGTPAARELLEQMHFLEGEWVEQGRVSSVYAHDGEVLDATENAAMYGALLPYFGVVNEEVAQKVHQEKLVYLYNPGANEWKETLSYYDDNWAWFGLGLYHGLLPNLAASLPAGSLDPT